MEVKVISSVADLYESWINDETTKLDEEAFFKSLLDYIESRKPEICGKCAPCRDGVTQLEKLLKDFVNNKADFRTLELFEQFVYNLRASKCSVGLDTGKNLEIVLKNNYHNLYDNVKEY